MSNHQSVSFSFVFLYVYLHASSLPPLNLLPLLKHFMIHRYAIFSERMLLLSCNLKSVYGRDCGRYRAILDGLLSFL